MTCKTCNYWTNEFNTDTPTAVGICRNITVKEGLNGFIPHTTERFKCFNYEPNNYQRELLLKIQKIEQTINFIKERVGK
jgi:hypothetical protein